MSECIRALLREKKLIRRKKKISFSKNQLGLKVKTSKLLKGGKTRVTKLLLVLGLHLIS